MKMPKTLLPLLLFSTHALAQYNLTATVTSSDGVGISFANVVLKNNSNESVIGTMTDELGKFQVKLSEGSYTLAISCVGFENYTQQVDVKNELNMGKIILKSSAVELQGVVVSAKQPLIVRKIDRLVFNVEQNPIIIGGDPLMR